MSAWYAPAGRLTGDLDPASRTDDPKIEDEITIDFVQFQVVIPAGSIVKRLKGGSYYIAGVYRDGCNDEFQLTVATDHGQIRARLTSYHRVGRSYGRRGGPSMDSL